jgi:hypothetical protein
MIPHGNNEASSSGEGEVMVKVDSELTQKVLRHGHRGEIAVKLEFRSSVFVDVASVDRRQKTAAGIGNCEESVRLGTRRGARAAQRYSPSSKVRFR